MREWYEAWGKIGLGKYVKDPTNGQAKLFFNIMFLA